MLHLDTSQLDKLTQDESVFDASLRGDVKAQYGAEGIRLLDGNGNFLAENDAECVVVYTDDGPFLLDAQVFAALYKVNARSAAPTPTEPTSGVEPGQAEQPAGGATLVGGDANTATGTTTTTITGQGDATTDNGTTTAPPVTSVAGLFSHA